ncbi:hypothetical protein ACET3Z_025741 [Daucus carota]
MSDKMTESHVAAQCHLEAQPLDGVPVNVSSSGGIPILEHIEIEDVSSDDKTISPTTARNICNSDMSATVQAVLRTSKHERDALIAARRKLMQFSSFLKRKGFSEEDIFEKLHQDGYFSRPCERDDFGLPKLSSCCKSALPSEEPKLFDELSHKENGVGKAPNVVAPNPFVDKMKGKIDLGVDNKVFDEGKWVRKDRTSANGPSEKPSVATSPQPPVGNTSCPESTTPVTLGHTPAKVPTPAACSDDSATPIKAFKNLRKVDEIDAKQAVVTGPDEPLFIPSKSQRKRLKKAQGKSSTPPPL